MVNILYVYHSIAWQLSQTLTAFREMFIYKNIYFHKPALTPYMNGSHIVNYCSQCVWLQYCAEYKLFLCFSALGDYTCDVKLKVWLTTELHWHIRTFPACYAHCCFCRLQIEASEISTCLRCLLRIWYDVSNHWGKPLDWVIDVIGI